MITKGRISPVDSEKDLTADSNRLVALARIASRVFILATLTLFVYGLAWIFSNRRYLQGFVEAIIPLAGSPQEKTEALAEWFHNKAQRTDSPPTVPPGLLSDRDPVYIVQNARLLKVCGSASSAFANLGDAAGLKVRRVLLLDQSGGAKHVVVEVQWGDRWVVVDPQQGRVFKDRLGRALTKEELRDSEVFRDAISRMPGYSPMYTFERTTHIRLKRIPILGDPLRRALDRFAPGWEEAIDWGYVPENPSFWPILASLPLLLVGILIRLIVERYRSADFTNYADNP